MGWSGGVVVVWSNGLVENGLTVKFGGWGAVQITSTLVYTGNTARPSVLGPTKYQTTTSTMILTVNQTTRTCVVNSDCEPSHTS